MNKIKMLSEDVISKISAGEIIERPASIVKELIENSIDSKANEIQIEVENAGKKKIKVVDNGYGMSREDACICMERYATSKIKSIEDLKVISTFGFRGEALASIAAVSDFEVITKEKKDNFGIKISINSGKEKISTDVGCPEGTTIVIKDIFRNVPVRLKFLKSVFTELSHISEIVFKESLTYPHISFKLIHNKDIIYSVSKEDNIIDRVVLYYGKEVEKELIPIEPIFSGDIINVSGIISKPSYTKPNRSYESIFINRRVVSDRIIANAISTAYDTLLQKDRFPLVVLFIEINTELVDVNVHPTKREVRFANPNEIHKNVVQGIRETLKKNNIIKKETIIYDTTTSFTENSKALPYNQLDMISRAGEVKEAIHEYLSCRRNLLQVHNMYIISESNREGEHGIYIIDQHAAHERIIYEEIVNCKTEQNSLTESQGLLLPINLNLTASETNILEENIVYFDELGFEIADLGKFTFSIHAVPRILADKNCKNIIIDILANLLEEKVLNKIDVKDKIIKTIACRSASMAGDKLEQKEMELIAGKIEKCKLPYCPHGRPAVVFLTLPEINKMFKRVTK